MLLRRHTKKIPAPFQKSMPYQHPNCCVEMRQEYPNIPMLRGVRDK